MCVAALLCLSLGRWGLFYRGMRTAMQASDGIPGRRAGEAGQAGGSGKAGANGKGMVRGWQGGQAWLGDADAQGRRGWKGGRPGGKSEAKRRPTDGKGRRPRTNQNGPYWEAGEGRGNGARRPHIKNSKR